MNITKRTGQFKNLQIVTYSLSRGRTTNFVIKNGLIFNFVLIFLEYFNSSLVQDPIVNCTDITMTFFDFLFKFGNSFFLRICFLLDYRYTTLSCLISFSSNSDKLCRRFRWPFGFVLFLLFEWKVLTDHCYQYFALCLFLPNASNIKFQTSTGGKAASRCWIL